MRSNSCEAQWAGYCVVSIIGVGPCLPAAKRRDEPSSHSNGSSMNSSSEEVVVMDPMGYYRALGLTPSSQVG